MIFHEKEKGPKVWVGKKRFAYIRFIDDFEEGDLEEY